MGRKKAELVDLTQEDHTTRRDSTTIRPITITLDDSIHHQQQYHQHHHHHQQQQRQQIRSQTPPELIDVSDSDSEHGQPIKKRIVTHSTNRRSSLTNHHTPPTRKPTPKPESPDDSLKCPICIETYKNIKKTGIKIVVTRCGHLFCESCLKKAFVGNGRKCPKCRKTVTKGPTSIIEIFDVC